MHCYASLSRSVVFILAYLMKTRGLSATKAAALMKPKWDADPNPNPNPIMRNSNRTLAQLTLV